MAHSSRIEEKETADLRQGAAELGSRAQAMFHTCLDAFIKQDMDTLNRALKDEETITEIYNKLTALAVETIKKDFSKIQKKQIVDLIDIVAAIERIGDCCVGLAERIEYKIKENLLFSEAAVGEYQGLHGRVEKILAEAVEAVNKKEKKLAAGILKKEEPLNALVDEYRANHIERSAKGVCNEWARVRYLDMLDLTNEIAHHCMDIAKKV